MTYMSFLFFIFLISFNYIDIDDCASDPCLNNAICMDQLNGFSCICAEGWTGPTCSLGIIL